MNKLLNRTLKPITIYALLVLVLSVPAYFFIVDFLWVRELDKHHNNLRIKIESRINKLNLSNTTLEQTIAIWNEIEPGSTFTPVDAKDIKADSTYSEIRFDKFMQEREQFRGLVTYVRINDRPYRLLIETNMEESDETVAAIAATTILFFLLLLSGFVFLTRRLSLRIWQPFYQTLDQLRSFNLNSEQSLQFQPSEIQEFEELNQGVSKLIDKNIATYKQQKEFAENASHELQTPLAIVQSRLDLLWQSDFLTEEQSNSIESASKALSRVSRINKNLLLLARIENYQFADLEGIDLSLLLTELVGILEEHSSEKHLPIRKKINPEIIIEANRILIEILLNNLIINAIRHTTERGEISIELSPVHLIISNPGDLPLNHDKLFKRFITASKETPGSGLGLSIVKQICERYGWEIRYYFVNGRHIFKIDF